MTTKKKILFPILSLCIASSVLADSFNIEDRVKSQNIFLKNYKSVFGHKQFAHKNSFFKEINDLKGRKRKKTLTLLKSLDEIFPDKIARSLTYWKGIKGDNQHVANTLEYYMIYKLFILRDHIDDPLSSEELKTKSLRALRELLQDNNVNSNNISKHFPKIQERAKQLANISGDQFANELSNEPLISKNLLEVVPGLYPYSLSAVGFIPGNKSEIVSENVRSLERIDWFNERVIFAGGKLDFDSDYVKMPTEKDQSGHIVFKEDPIYMKIREMIDRAEHSIFIDIFLFGGTLGATLTEYLLDETIKKVQKNPNFKVLVLHDYATNYNMVEEMLPIFQYIQKRIKEEPIIGKSVSLLQANIQRHPPGVPFNITKLIPKDSNSFKYFEGGNTYFESKIDHSKVIVVDGNHDDAEAYFGSKNWTDHSGGYYYDDAVYVTGPAAALVQASYYRDLEAALTSDPKELPFFYYKELGLDNKAYLPKKKEILDNFRITKKNYKHLGDSTIRIAEADVDGTIKNVRNMLIDMIAKAKSHIYMEQLFLYDPYIVNALIKKRSLEPNVDIKLVIDHNGNFGMNGLPNTIYVKKMVDADIAVRARKTYGITAHFPDGTEKEYHQENHRKITSIDGKVVLGGSSNINPDTLQGSFREFGAQVFDRAEVSSFEQRFLRDWKDADKMSRLDIENFEAKVLGKKFSKRVSAFLNSLAGMVFKSKDELEKRH